MSSRICSGLLCCGLIAGLVGCHTPDPPYQTGSFELETPATGDPQSRASIEAVEQPSSFFGATPEEQRPPLIVDIDIEPLDEQTTWQLERDDVRLLAETPEGTSLVARNTDTDRAPDRMKLDEDGDWNRAGTLELQGDRPHSIRLEFDNLLPFAVPDDIEGTRYTLPVDLTVVVPTGPDDETTELTVTSRSHPAPRWARDSTDHRLYYAIAPAFGFFDYDPTQVSTMMSMTIGFHHHFTNDAYLRWGWDLQVGTALQPPREGGPPLGVGELFLQTAPLVTAGYNFSLPETDIGVGAGWVPTLTTRGRAEDDDPAIPHWAVLEATVSLDPGQPYPYRTEDFIDNFGLYFRSMHQLGNLGPRDEPGGHIFVLGLTMQAGF